MEKSAEFLEELERLYQRQYVSLTDLEEVKSQYEYRVLGKVELRKKVLKLLLSCDFKGLKEFWRTERRLYRYLEERDKMNREFIKKEQKKPYEIEGNRLDPQQIEAVVACEDAALFLAPAGSGKSASLLAKVEYLTEVLKIPPEKVLVIAFTNKVVAELKDRVKESKVEIRTFHSLGNKIIKAKTKGQKLISEAKTGRFFHQEVGKLLKNAKYAKKFENYLRANRLNLDMVEQVKNKEQSETEELEALFISVLGLQKSERADLMEFKRRIESIKNVAEREKALRFFDLYVPVVRAYQKYLKEQGLYDFADMLNRATDIVEAMPQGSLDYQYILVDEAQDLSRSKYLLLKAILAKCERVKLFAVGDDWQSIYRFAGSNLGVLDEFEQIFERTTYRGMIELTYRFGQPTAKISNKFIQKNPHQSRKRVVPHVKRRTPIEVRLNLEKLPKGVPQDYEVVNQKIQELYAEYGEGLFEKRVQIISRYNRDIYRVVGADKVYKNAELVDVTEEQTKLEWKIEGTTRKLKVPFCSMHKAKGITRDIVLVINMNKGAMGMPAVRESDAVAEVLLAKLDAYPFAEERRLFYVAITRAKERTILVADARCISDFVFEVSPKLKGADVKVCPKCKKGILVECRRKRDGKVFDKCSGCGCVG